MLVAHRGASHAAPECTLAAYRLAVEEKADAYEGDFWLTADDRVVCIHDPDTSRVTDGDTVLDVRTSTLEQLRTLDVGSWKDTRFAGERIPTLEEVLDVLPANRTLLIEIKDSRPAIVHRVKKILAKSEREASRHVIIAFDPEIIRVARAELPEVKALWLYRWYLDEKTGRPSNTVAEILHVARDIGADGIDINRSAWVDAAFVERVHDAGLELHVYTVNELSDATRLVALGVDSITTDRPLALRREISEHFRPVEGSSDSTETVIVHPDGTWEYRP